MLGEGDLFFSRGFSMVFADKENNFLWMKYMAVQDLKYSEITNLIIKGFYEVYNELGPGYLESVYENALAIVLREYGLKVETQKEINVYFRGVLVGPFRADMVVEEKVLVELKAIKTLDHSHEAKVINYLKATGIEVSLLLNFGVQPQIRRLVYEKKKNQIPINPRQSAAQTSLPNNPKNVRALVITGFGINCEEEMAAAYRLVGAQANIVHLNEVFLERVSIHEYDILNFPGGFSFGDDIGSGKVLANKFKFKKMASGKSFMDEVRKFLADGKYIFGVCNGFQALVKMGLLPNVNSQFEQEATITNNASGKFEDRWVTLRVNPNSNSPFLKGMQVFDVPVRHGEGKLLIRDEQIRQAILDKHLNCLSYVNGDGKPTDKYPFNPNGSELAIAGLTDKSGQVFGLMPHPEAFLSIYNHPNWGKMKRTNPEIEEQGEGLKVFKNIILNIKSKAK